VNLTAIDAISAMVAPVVLLTVGGLISNGLLSVFAGLNQRLREMTRERIELLTGPAGEMLEVASVRGMSLERLNEVNHQIPLLLRRHRLTQAAVLVIYAAIAVHGLSIIFIAIAVAENNELIARVALALVLAGTVVLIVGIGIAGVSLAKSADAVVYAVERTRSLGRLRDPVRTRVGGWEFDEGDDPARHEARRADWRAGASYFRDLDEAAPRRDLDAAPRARGTDFVGSGPVADIDHDLDPITLHAAHPNHRTPIRYPILGRTKRHLPGHPAGQQWTVGCEKLALVWGGLNHAPVHGLSR
jgi:hypothetical protein